MILGAKNNDAQLMAIVPSIKNNLNEWQIVNVNIRKDSKFSRGEILEKLMSAYKDHDGIVYGLKDRKITCLVRLGIVNNYANIKTDLERKMPDQSCRIQARKMSPMGLKQIQIDLMDKDDGTVMDMFKDRENRKDNVVMIADDDMFIRKAMKEVLGFYGDCTEAATGDQVVGEYIRCNPDILLLDIHMPGKNGLDVIDSIMEVDSDAFIIVFSADSVADNVLQAMEKGAVGFVSKPPKKEKIIHYVNRCITIR